LASHAFPLVVFLPGLGQPPGADAGLAQALARHG
jgi:hypothetical protein